MSTQMTHARPENQPDAKSNEPFHKQKTTACAYNQIHTVDILNTEEMVAEILTGSHKASADLSAKKNALAGRRRGPQSANKSPGKFHGGR